MKFTQKRFEIVVIVALLITLVHPANLKVIVGNDNELSVCNGLFLKGAKTLTV